MKIPKTIEGRLNLARKLGERIGQVLYEINFRNAGVGCTWHDQSRAGPQPLLSSDVILGEKLHAYSQALAAWTKRGLVTHLYRPTLSRALREEILRLQKLQ